MSDFMTSPSDGTTGSIAVPVHVDVSADEFRGIVEETRRPFVIRGAEIGECRQKWMASYLREKGSGKRVTVHWGRSRRMDFVNKNFKYVEMDFGEFVEKAELGLPMKEDGADVEESGDKKNDPRLEDYEENSKIVPREWYYLRSLGSDPRRDVSDIRVGFPELARDFKIPHFVPEEAFFSSVFRIASPGMQLWTHYDVMDNALIQIRGRKRIVLFPPSDVQYLYMKGDKSLVLDIDSVDHERFPLMSRATRHECFLEPGDIIFIPALWFHNVVSLDFGVAVNVFWRHLPASFYDSKDVYGNRDPLPASRALQSLDRTITTLDKLPKDYRDFYLRRMMLRIEEKLQ